MRAKTVGSNGMGTTSDRSTKDAFVGYRSVIDERGSAVTLLGPIAWSCGIARQGGRCARHTVNHCTDRASWLKLSKETQAAIILSHRTYTYALPGVHADVQESGSHCSKPALMSQDVLASARLLKLLGFVGTLPPHL